MLQITADLSALTPEQREAVSEFILNFPSKNNHDSSDILDNGAIIPSFSEHVDDEDEPSPKQAFALPTQAAPSVATVAAVLPASPTPGVAATLDKNGIPWDERIHAGSRTKNADGLWRNKRGADAALVASVEAELHALMGLPAAPVVPAPPAPANPTIPAPPTADSKQAFVKLLTKATTLIQTQKLTQEELNAAVISTGVASLPLLAHRMDLVPQVEAIIDATVAGR